MKIIDPATGRLTRRARTADWLVRFVLPVFAAATALTGGCLTYNWTNAAANHPGLATIYLFVGDWIAFVFFTSAITSFVLSLLHGLMRPALKVLQSQVDLVGENFRALCDGLTADLATKLGIAPGDHSRVSLYLHDGDRSFVLCGRYSPNPALKKPGRPSYPDDQGCIAKGWEHGWWFENALGSRRTYTRNTETRYGIPQVITDALPMKPRLIAAQRIDYLNTPIAVIVVESMREDRFDVENLRADLSRAAGDYAPIMNTFKSYLPSPAVAAARGF